MSPLARMLAFVVLFHLAAGASTLYRLPDGSFKAPMNPGGPFVDHTTERYLLLRDDSTFLTATYPVGTFGNLAPSAAADSGRWQVGQDSILLTIAKSNGSLKFTTGFPPTLKLAFGNGRILASGFDTASVAREKEVRRRIEKAQSEIVGMNNANNVFMVLGIGALSVMLIIWLAGMAS